MTISSASNGARLADGFDESLHPRDEHGRFGDKGGGDQKQGLYPGGVHSVHEPLSSEDRARISNAENRIREALDPQRTSVGSSVGVDLSKMNPDLTPMLAESIERVTDEFPAVRENLRGVVIEPIGGGVLGMYQPGNGVITLNENAYGQHEIPHPAFEARRTGENIDTEMQPAGSFHPLNDAQSTFDHEIGHAVWKTATNEMQSQYRDQLNASDPSGRSGEFVRNMDDKEISARFMGFDPNADRPKAMDEDRKLAWPSTRTVTSGLRKMGSEYGAKSYLRQQWDSPSHDLNEGFAEWFSVRQREPMRSELESRTNDLLTGAFNRVLDYTRDAAPTAIAAAVSRPVTIPDVMPSSSAPTCYGYVSAEQWASMTKAERDALFPPPVNEQILQAAVEVAGDYGLDLVDGQLVTEHGLLFPPDTFVTIVHARLAAEREYVRDERGRFGEGDGGLADKNDTHFTTAADVPLVQWAQQFPKGTVFRSGSPSRLDAMRHGEDLGTPDPSGARGETYGEERIGGIWVSTTAKPEYLDKGEQLAAFDPSKSKVVNEGAPGDMLLDYVPAARLLGTWTPGPDGARGYDVTPPQARGRGMIRGVAPIGKAITASFNEDLHPRDKGKFASKEGDDASGKVLRPKVGDRVVLRSAALGPGHDTDDPLTGGERQGEVIKVQQAPRGQSKGGSWARVRWDNGSEGRHSLGLVRVVERDGKAITASFNEDLHPRGQPNNAGQFAESDNSGESQGNPKDEVAPAPIPRDANGKLDVDALLAQNPQQPDEDIFVYQGRVAHLLDDSQEQSDLLFAVRERYEPVQSVVDGMQQWQADHGLAPVPADIVEEHADLAEADAAGRAFENATDQAGDPHVEAAYEDFKRQNEEMFDFMTRPTAEGGMGINVQFTNQKDPYPTAAAQAEDLRNNNRIVIESGLGGNHTASMTTAEYDRFRAVHDTFGHAAIGGGFDRHGEYEAWLTHSMMYTPPGRDAMSTEYHGVNSAMWSGNPSDPGGTGKTVLLGEYATPPWERTKAAAMQAAAAPWITPPEIAQLIERVGFDANFANHFMPCRWHYDEVPTARVAYAEGQARDERGRFGEGTTAGDAPLIEGHAKVGELITMNGLPQKIRDAAMAKVTGTPPPPVPKDENGKANWPKDKDGNSIVPQPPDNADGSKGSWGLGVTAAQVEANYDATYERAKEDPALIEAGMTWYEREHDNAARLGDEYGYDMENAAVALAEMSAGTKWETEMPVLETMMRLDGGTVDLPADRLANLNEKLTGYGLDHVANGMDYSQLDARSAVLTMHEAHQSDVMARREAGATVAETPSWGASKGWGGYERALDALRGNIPPEELSGIKYREFYNNLSNPGVEGHVTIDKVMMQVATQDPATTNETRITSQPTYKGSQLGPVPVLADITRTMAEREGIRANQMQAILWLQWQKEHA